MTYSAEISRKKPTLFLFLIDQSGSMDEPFGKNPDERKADGLANVINRFFANLVLKCTKGDEIWSYYDIGVIGYAHEVRSAFKGQLENKIIHSVEKIGNNPLRVEERLKKISDGAGGITEINEAFPVWIDPVCDGGTPMCKAFTIAKENIENWLETHQDSYPPTILNITDGESTDGVPTSIVRDIQSLGTKDGNVLVFNCHLSSTTAPPIIFPDDANLLPDEFAKLLFEISSILPDKLRSFAEEARYTVSKNSRGFSFNADLVHLVEWLDVGTRLR